MIKRVSQKTILRFPTQSRPCVKWRFKVLIRVLIDRLEELTGRAFMK